MLDTETDGGNYYGVAVYVQGQEVVLVSQMQAGWYRYISEWRFSSDGTIRPRFGFSAAQNSCVCNLHHHHVYWRLHFDIGAAQKNIVQEYNDPPIADTLNWHNLLFEIRRLKDTDHQRRWQVKNSETGDGYTLIPGKNDGVADVDFGVGDVWVLRYHDTEVDDSQADTTGNVSQLKANIDQFANGESVNQQDVVVWYAAHFTHDFNVESGHIVGPELVPVQW